MLHGPWALTATRKIAKRSLQALLLPTVLHCWRRYISTKGYRVQRLGFFKTLGYLVRDSMS